MRAVVVSACALFLTGCSAIDRGPVWEPSYHPEQVFNDYWYTGDAELTRFELKQARYGEVHKGEAVMIFVAEHISPQSHLKTDNRNGLSIPVLKLNFTRTFRTGVYPYSVMTSVFTPTDLAANAHTMRVTFSMQEWCGHVFGQLDRVEDGYEGISHSYFPGEGDRKLKLDGVLLEDELWNRIRMGPEYLPTGSLRVLPSFQHLRFRHEKARELPAEAGLDTTRAMLVYNLVYEDGRSLRIDFEEHRPHRILGWSEIARSGFGPTAALLKTEARAIRTSRLDYWKHNSPSDSTLRSGLGFPY